MRLFGSSAMSLLIQALLLVLGCWWCKEIFGRLREDVGELKEPDGVRRAVIVGMWVATAVILFFMMSFVWALVVPIVRSFQKT